MSRKSAFNSSDYFVKMIDQVSCEDFIRAHHYARGSSHTSTFRFGLFEKGSAELKGVTMWLPPTRRAAEAVDRYRWQKVLSLTRMAVAPGVPKNACSFMLSRSVKAMKSDGRFVSFVTYADTGEDHDGHVYIASNWLPFGKSKPTPRWVDPKSGKQVAQLSTKTRSVSAMGLLGYVRKGRSIKKRFVLYPNDDLQSKLLRLGAVLHTLMISMKDR